MMETTVIYCDCGGETMLERDNWERSWIVCTDCDRCDDWHWEDGE